MTLAYYDNLKYTYTKIARHIDIIFVERSTRVLALRAMELHNNLQDVLRSVFSFSCKAIEMMQN